MVALFKDGRWNGWTPSRYLAANRNSTASLVHKPAKAWEDMATSRISAAELKKSIGSVTFAFCGYDTSNLGRSPEFLDHPAYGPLVREILGEASEICTEVCGERVDLAERIAAHEGSTLESYPYDVAMIVAMEIAQIRLLETFFEIPIPKASSSFGFSLGEVSALVASGVFSMKSVLSILLPLARDCVDLATDTSMGILFTRGPTLPMREVQRLCLIINSEGRGLMGPSAFLSPNAVLLLGQEDTLDRFEKIMGKTIPGKVSLRRHKSQWPPLHTPLVWQGNIPSKVALALFKLEGEPRRPMPPVVSCVTGEASYDELNSRELLIQWTDHPQKLWDVIQETLASPASIIVHVGPEPKLIPATFARLSNSIVQHLGGRAVRLMRNTMIPSMSSSWLTRFLPAGTALWRAPFIEHVILEDWLLKQEIA